MAEFTPYKGLNVPAAGTPNWDVPVNTDWRTIDQAISGMQWVNAAGFQGNVYLSNAYPSGSSDPATALSCLPSTIVIYGAITGQVNLVFPDGLSGHWIIRNATSGNFPVCAVSATGTYNFLPIPQNGISHVHGDGHSFYFIGAVPAVSQVAMVGEIKAWSGGWTPGQWMICDGRWLDRYANNAAYGPLYNVFGYAYGGNGSNAFAIPDLRGRVIAGSDQMGTQGNANRLGGWTICAAGGAASTVLSVEQMPVHTHYDYGHGHGVSQNPHHHNLVVPHNERLGSGVQSGNGWRWDWKDTQDSSVDIGIAAGYANLTNAGSSWGVSLVQPTFVLHYIIYTGV